MFFSHRETTAFVHVTLFVYINLLPNAFVPVECHRYSGLKNHLYNSPDRLKKKQLLKMMQKVFYI